MRHDGFAPSSYTTVFCLFIREFWKATYIQIMLKIRPCGTSYHCHAKTVHSIGNMRAVNGNDTATEVNATCDGSDSLA